jgi:hypothetical protein
MIDQPIFMSADMISHFRMSSQWKAAHSRCSDMKTCARRMIPWRLLAFLDSVDDGATAKADGNKADHIYAFADRAQVARTGQAFFCQRRSSVCCQ